MSMRFRRDADLIVVPTLVWGPAGHTSARLVLDTGAAASTLGWGVLVSVGYAPEAATEQVHLATASAVEFVPRIRVQKLQALGRERRDLPIVCHNLPPSAGVDGVLGLDFLRGQRLVVDFRAGLVSLD